MAVLIAPVPQRKLGSLIKDFLALSSPVFRTHFLGHRSPLSYDRLGFSIAGCVNLGRAVGPRLMSGCGAGSRATCSAALFGALEAYPPVGTTPGGTGGGAGGGLPDVYEIAINPHTRF